MKRLGTGGVRADLSEEGDWLLTHSVCIPDVSLDDLSKRLFRSLQSQSTKHKGISEQIVLCGQLCLHIYCQKVDKNRV